MREKIEEAIQEIRSMLKPDGADIELVGVDGGTVQVRFIGICAECTGAFLTLRRGVERLLREQVPEVKEVVVL